MMQRLFFVMSLALAAMLLPRQIKAQQVIYSAYQKYDSRNGDFSVVGRVNSQLFTYRSDADGYYLETWDDSMNRVATVVLDFFPKKVYHTRFVAYPQKIIVLYQTIERNHIQQFAAMLDNRGLLLGKPLLVDDVKTSIFGTTGTYFTEAVSENKKFILFYHADPDRKSISYTGTLINDSLLKVKRFTANYEADEEVSPADVLTGNDGEILFSVTKGSGRRDYSEDLRILSLKPDQNRLTSYRLPLQGLFGQATIMRMAAGQDRIYIAGFYSNAVHGSYDGIFFTSFNLAAHSFDSLRHMPFDETLRSATGSRNPKHAFNDFEVRQLIVRNDGGFVLVAESNYEAIVNGGSPFGFYSYYNTPFGPGASIHEYYYNDILALSYDANGTMSWNNFIRKEQFSQEDFGRFSSYALLNTGGTLAFLFNDFNHRHSTIQLATIDPAGVQDHHAMAAGNDTDPDWLPRFGKQTGQRELIVPCLRRREICFARIIF